MISVVLIFIISISKNKINDIGIDFELEVGITAMWHEVDRFW